MKSQNPSPKQQRGTSAPQNTATKSGSRPNGGKVKTPSSMPMQEHKLGRAPSGWLK